MPIPNIWPDGRAKKLCRALNNIVANRVAPGAAPQRNQFLRGNINVGGQQLPCVLDVRCSTNSPNHHIRLPASVCQELSAETEQNPDRFVGMLALHRVPTDDASRVHRWTIPSPVVRQMHESLPADVGDEPNLRNVDIRRENGRWLWYAPADRTINIDITAHYEPWELTNDEVRHIADGMAGRLESPPPPGNEGRGGGDVGVGPEHLPPQQLPAIVGCNRIYFGPPGTGKSRRIADLLADGDLASQAQRVTFHPEYTYSDFVGAYRPVTVYGGDEQFREAGGQDLAVVGRPAVVYRYVAGPLVRMIEAAMRDPEHPYYLVIEEINRGNCAAIFGDLFQLLDRGLDASSEYEVRAEVDLMHHLEAAARPAHGAPEAVRLNYRRFTTDGLFLPANLSLYATMNTSDQSLYPMDAAMKRRWEMQYVPINYREAQGRRATIKGYGEKDWGNVLFRINREIVIYTHTDDKQIGQWFVKTEAVGADTFRDKVLSYLWFDVFRSSPRDLFDLGNSPYSYESLVATYDRDEKVFKANVIDDGPAAAPGQPLASDGSTSAGFRAEGGRLRVTLPGCIRGAEMATPHDMVALYRVLRHYHLEEQRERSTVQEIRGLPDPVVRVDAPAMHWIECALELLDDYAQRGLLRYERRITHRIPNGRIDWRTTVRRELPCFTEDSALYFTPFRHAVEAHADHPLTELHAQTIGQLCRAFEAEPEVETRGGQAKPIGCREAMTTLIRERNRIFRDRDRRIVKLLERYWMGTDLRRREGFRGDLLWTDQFEFVWQRMAERVIGGRHVDRNGLPKGRYREDQAEHRGLDLRPDLVVDVAPQTRIIFDAKYYTSGTLPPSGDVLKQLAYSYFSSRQWNPTHPQYVVNIFLLPADSPLEAVRLSGRHRLLDLTPQQDLAPLAGDIWLFRIDYRALAESYLGRSRWDCALFLDQIRRFPDANQ